MFKRACKKYTFMLTCQPFWNLGHFTWVSDWVWESGCNLACQRICYRGLTGKCSVESVCKRVSTLNYWMNHLSITICNETTSTSQTIKPPPAAKSKPERVQTEEHLLHFVVLSWTSLPKNKMKLYQSSKYKMPIFLISVFPTVL